MGRQAEDEPHSRAWPTGEEAPLAVEHGDTRAAKVAPHALTPASIQPHPLCSPARSHGAGSRSCTCTGSSQTC